MSRAARMTPLGRYYVLTMSLNKNKLSLCTEGGRCMFKRELITDELKHVIKQLAKNNYDIEDKVDLLDDRDQKILKEVLDLCQLDNCFDLSYDQTKARLISRFNVMRDEIMIGNYSDELIEQFKEILVELFTRKLLTQKEFNKMINIADKCLTPKVEEPKPTQKAPFY